MLDKSRARRLRSVNSLYSDRHAGLTRAQIVSFLLSALVWLLILLVFLQSLIVRFAAIPDVGINTVEHEFALAPSPRPAPPPIVAHPPRSATKPRSKGSAPSNRERRPLVARVPAPDLPVVPLSIDRTLVPFPAPPVVVGSTVPAKPGNEGVGVGSGPGGAVGKGSGPLIVSGAYWIRKPTDADMAGVDPFRAQIDHVSGVVVLSCLIDDHARAKRCHVLSETPRNYGFGAAALSLTPTFRIQVANIDGKDVNDIPARIPITFTNNAAAK